jgi:hypothetical protein
MECDFVGDEERMLAGGVRSRPKASTSTPSLMTTVPPVCSACSKLMSTREVRLALASTRFRLRSSLLGWSPDGKADGGTGERGEDVGLRNIGRPRRSERQFKTKCATTPTLAAIPGAGLTRFVRGTCRLAISFYNKSIVYSNRPLSASVLP